MNWKRVVKPVLLVTTFCLAAYQDGPEAREPSQSSSQTRTPVKPTLAKTKVSEAMAAAKKWKADAILIQIAGRNISDDGTYVLWDYGFYSPAAKNCLVVNVATTTTQQESGGAMCESSELTEFMDSDQAMSIARKNGITKPRASMVASASGRGAIWTVMDEGGMKPGNVMLDIDAKTGGVLNKTSQR